MSDLISRTARLVPYTKRPKHSASFVTAYVYEPAADDADALDLGNLFVVTEVLTSGRASEEVVDLIIESAGEKYYNEPNGHQDQLSRFEAAIKQTNHELSEYVGRGNAAWIGKLSAIIAVQTGTQLHVSHTGSAEAFLYRGKAVSRITQSESSKPATPSKTFGSIATGELEVGDKFLLATPALIHQVPLTKLQAVVASASPNSAISELSQLLERAETERIAAIVVEMTTPELAAVKVRSDEPSEIELGNGESLAEAAISAAAPLAQTTAQTSKRAVRVTAAVASRLGAHLRRATLAVAERARSLLATQSGRRGTLIVLVAVIALISLLAWQSNNQSANAKQFTKYQSLFQQYSDIQSASFSDKAAAKSSLESIRKELAGLKQNQALIDQQLKNQPLLQNEPATYSGFVSKVSASIDELDGLVKASPMTLAEIGGKSGKPVHFETDGTRAYVIDAGAANHIVIVTLTTGDQKDSKADTSKLGEVISTTLSSTNDGIFILTGKPSVWFYRFANDTLTEQTLAYGQWPKSHAIGSYGSNLYLLGDKIVYKHVKNATGYSPKTDYISTTEAATALAVDGYVYLSSKTNLQQLLGPTPKDSAEHPGKLSPITNLRSAATGDILVGTSQGSKRIIVWSTTKNDLLLIKQISLSDSGTLYDAVYDQKSARIYATLDNRFVSIPFKP